METPYEFLYSRNPNSTNIQEFGALFVKVPEEDPNESHKLNVVGSRVRLHGNTKSMCFFLDAGTLGIG